MANRKILHPDALPVCGYDEYCLANLLLNGIRISKRIVTGCVATIISTTNVSTQPPKDLLLVNCVSVPLVTFFVYLIQFYWHLPVINRFYWLTSCKICSNTWAMHWLYAAQAHDVVFLLTCKTCPLHTYINDRRGCNFWACNRRTVDLLRLNCQRHVLQRTGSSQWRHI